MNYWSDKERLKALAATHTATMAQKYRKDILASVEGTEAFDDNLEMPKPCESKFATQVVFEQGGSVGVLESLCMTKGGKVCVLDFADYMRPGGKFLEGSGAQEERLCHDSFLYNVLKSERIRDMFYDTHKGAANKCLYSNHLLYVPQVLFKESVPCDVIVCAAPNKGAAMRYNHVAPQEVNRCMRERCNAVLRAAAHNVVEHLVLGAFGCGVFGNDPVVVSVEFKSLLEYQYRGIFKTVVFAVPDEQNGQFFRAVCNK